MQQVVVMGLRFLPEISLPSGPSFDSLDASARLAQHRARLAEHTIASGGGPVYDTLQVWLMTYQVGIQHDALCKASSLLHNEACQKVLRQPFENHKHEGLHHHSHHHHWWATPFTMLHRQGFTTRDSSYNVMRHAASQIW